MALSMAQPWQDPKFRIFSLRQCTAADLKSCLSGRVVTLPIGEEFATVKVGAMAQASLRTSDPTAAKERHAIADLGGKRGCALRHGSSLTISGVPGRPGAVQAVFCRLMDVPRFATRYDKLARNYASAIALAAVVAFWC